MSEKEKTETRYHTRPIAWVVKPIGEPIFSESATRVEIVDEAAGEFVDEAAGEFVDEAAGEFVDEAAGEIVKLTDGQCNSVNLNPEEWPCLWDLLNDDFSACVKNEEEK